MTMSFTLKYTGSCPDPAEPSAGTSPPARAPLWFPAAAGNFGKGWRSTGSWEKMRICCCLPSPLLPGGRDGAAEGPHCGVFTPGETTWPGSLQTWAYVASDRQELYPNAGDSGAVSSSSIIWEADCDFFLSATATWSRGWRGKNSIHMHQPLCSLPHGCIDRRWLHLSWSLPSQHP